MGGRRCCNVIRVDWERVILTQFNGTFPLEDTESYLTPNYITDKALIRIPSSNERSMCVMK
jgi:2-hydroxy-3-keto-5-methylthiopentenyl-1-phosphate phosphatase